jgi:hypothetical protein
MSDFLSSDLTTASEIRDQFSGNNDQCVKQTVKALRKNNASPEQLAQVKSAMGITAPVAESLGSSIPLLDLALLRTGAALGQIMSACPDMSWEYRCFTLGGTSTPDRDGMNLQIIKKHCYPIMRDIYEHALAKVAVRLHETGPRLEVVVIGGMRQSPIKRRRQAGTPDSTVADDRPVISRAMGTERRDITAAAANLWQLADASALAGVSKREKRKLLVDAFVLQTLLRPERSMFGVGWGKTALRAIAREIQARARSFDLAGASPLQPQAISGMLAGLPVDADGTNVALPPLKLL